MPTPAKTVVLLAAVAVIAIAVIDWRQNIPRETAAPETALMNQRVEACDRTGSGQKITMPPGGTAITVSATTRMFLTLPRDLYPEGRVGVQEQNASMGMISNGEFANDPKSPCWTHYYEFDLAPGATDGKLVITAKSADPAIPDYSIYVNVVNH